MSINIIIIGNTNNFDIADALIKDKRINIIAGIIDRHSQELQEKQKTYLQKNNIKEISFEEVNLYNPDLCLILTYFTLIPIHYFANTKILNIHGGILPKWRGANSNAWAVINGANEVGYTLHEATNELDGGDIYFQFKTQILKNEKYGEVIPRLRQGMIDNLSNILTKITNNAILPVSQKGQMHLYTPKLRKSDGIITNWNKTSEYFYNLYRVMGTPYGTGVFFKFKEQLYEIRNMHLVENCPPYIGIPGAIVYTKNNYMYIKTMDTVISITELYDQNNKRVDLQSVFKMGFRL